MSKTEGPWKCYGAYVSGNCAIFYKPASKFLILESEEAAEAKADELNKLEAVREAAPELLEACKAVLEEAAQRCRFWEEDYNPDAHVEITLTVAECRAIQNSIKKATGAA